MKKTIAMLASILLAAVSVVSCGNDKDSSEESTAPKTAASTEASTEAETETDTEAETTTEAETEAKTEADTKDALEEIEDLGQDIDMSSMFTTVDAPEFSPKTAEENDFVGKWECTCMVADGAAYDSIFGVPLYAMFHVELKDDHTGFIASIDDPTSDSSETTDFTWEFADGTITFSADDEELSGAINSDGSLVLYDEEQTEMLYFRSVAEYTEFDFSALEDMFGGLTDAVGEETAADTDAE